MLSSNSLRQTVYTHCTSVQQPAKLVAALLRIARVPAGLVESNSSLPPGLWLTSPAGWLPRTRICSGTLRSAIEYRLSLLFYFWLFTLSQSTCPPNLKIHHTNLWCTKHFFIWLKVCIVLAFSIPADSYLRFPVLAFSAPPDKCVVK